MIDNDDFRKDIVSSPLFNSIAVQAGPGSGKTKLLIERLKYIIENRNSSLSGIACITYTNAAKNEIMERLQYEGVQLPSELFIGTIHSLLLEYIIKPYSYLFNVHRKPYKLASVGFARKYKRDIKLMLGSDGHFIKESTLKALESLGRDEEGNPYCYLNKINKDIALKWKRHVISEGYIDQQDVIYLSYRLIMKYGHIRDGFSCRFPYILVDEYQDVTFYQEKILSLLNYSSLFCVGDINQSIYSFTGSKPKVFQDKWKNENYYKYVLTNNFRSSPHIVRLINCKSKLNQIEKGDNANIEQKVLFIKNTTDPSEAINLFNKIRMDIKYADNKKPYMILARGNDTVKNLQQITKNKNVTITPFLKKLSIEHYRCFQILQNILLSIHYKSLNKIEDAMQKIAEALSYLLFNTQSNYAPISEINYSPFMWRKLQIYTLNFIYSISFTETTVANLFLLLKRFLSEESKNLFGRSIGRKLLILNYKWKNQVAISKSITLSQLLEEVKSNEDFSNKEEKIFTIHASKGLEAECVLVMADSKSQLVDWLKENNELEEARVGYVAFSRARKLLCVWAPSIQEKDFVHLSENVLFIEDRED